MGINFINLLGIKPTIVNQKSPWGLQDPGNTADGAIYQFNDGKADTFTYSGANAGKAAIFCGDSSDTLTLDGGWKSKGYAEDNQSHIAGQLLDDGKGHQLLVSGNVKLAGDISGTSDAPAQSGSPGAPVNLQANLTGQKSDAFGADHQSLIDRINWAIGNGGGTDKVGADGTILKTNIETAITGLQKAETTLDANNQDQKNLDEKQITFLKTFLDT